MSEKPKFDPNKSFSIPGGKPAFDPSAPFEAAKPQEDVLSKQGAEAALQGFGKTATLGYLPQLQTITQPISDRLLNLLPGQDVEPAPLKQMIPGTAEYLKGRDLNIQRQNALEEKSPVASTIGQVGGSLASAMLPMGALSKAGSIGKAALSGGLLGAVQNPGDIQGQINPVQVKERIQQGLTGAALGGAAQGLTSGLTSAVRGLKKLPESLENVSNSMAFKALGAGKGDIKKMLTKDLEGGSLRDLGKFAKEKGLVKGGDSILDVAERTNKFQEQAGAKIGEIYDDLAQKFGNPDFLNKLPKPQRLEAIKTNFRPKQMAQEFMDEATAKWTGKRGGQAALNRVQSEVDDLMKNSGLLGIKDVHDFRVALDKTIRFEKDEPVQQGLKDFRNFLNKKIENRIDFLDKVEGSSKTKALKAANEDYSKIAKINKFVTNKVSGDKANNFFGLPDYIMMGAGGLGGLLSGATGDSASVQNAAEKGILGLGAGLLSKGARRFGTPLVMSGAEKLGGLLQGPAKLVPNIPNLDPRLVGGAAERLYNLNKGK